MTDRTTLYASSAEIYKSQANLLDVNNQPLDPITGTNYEIGIKSTLFNDQLNTSLALYQVKKEGEGKAEVSPNLRAPLIINTKARIGLQKVMETMRSNITLSNLSSAV